MARDAAGVVHCPGPCAKRTAAATTPRANPHAFPPRYRTDPGCPAPARSGAGFRVEGNRVDCSCPGPVAATPCEPRCSRSGCPTRRAPQCHGGSMVKACTVGWRPLRSNPSGRGHLPASRCHRSSMYRHASSSLFPALRANDQACPGLDPGARPLGAASTSPSTGTCSGVLFPSVGPQPCAPVPALPRRANGIILTFRRLQPTVSNRDIQPPASRRTSVTLGKAPSRVSKAESSP